MADKVKNYGIAGTAANIQLGKGGAIINGSNANVMAITDVNSNVVSIVTAEGTENSHAVTKSQLDPIDDDRLRYQTFTVDYNSGTINLANATANTRIVSVVAEAVSEWTGANESTTITVGDTGDTDRLFTGFDPEVQSTGDTNHLYEAETTIAAYVEDGAATAGNAKITVWYIGTLTPPPTGPTYSIAPEDDRFIIEGNSITMNVTTTNVGSATLYWTINHQTTSSSDFIASSGTVGVVSNSGSFVITTVEDFATEGNETFAVQLRTGSVSGNVVATTGNMTVSDTSRTVTVTADSNSVNEGNAVVFTVATDNFGNGTLYYSVEGINFTGVVRGAVSTDFEGNVLPSGSVNIVNDSGTVTVTTRADELTEGAEGFRLHIRNLSVSGDILATSANITINDTSRPEYSIEAVANIVNEGDNVTFTVTTLNVVNQTLRFTAVGNSSINALNSTFSTDFDTVGGVNPSTSYVNFSLVDNAGTFTVPIRSDLVGGSGIDWVSGGTPPENNTWNSVAYGDGVWIAVSTNGTNRVMRSTDSGVNWSSVAAAEANEWRSVAYGNGVWVAVASTGTNRVMRSTDGGVTWSAVAAAEANQWNSVAYGNGVWVATAISGTNRVMRSTNDGVSWTAVTPPTWSTSPIAWPSVAYGNGVWIAVSSSGTSVQSNNRVMRSTDDGVSWTLVAAANPVQYTSVAYGNGVWVAVARTGTVSGAGNGRAMRSTDGGVTWTSHNATSGENWNSVAYGAGVWVAVAQTAVTGSSTRTMRSTNGSNWSSATVPDATGEFTSVAYGGGMWVSLGSSTTNPQFTLRNSVNQGFHVDIVPASTTTVLARSEVITIVEPPILTITPAALTVDEGESLQFTVTADDLGVHAANNTLRFSVASNTSTALQSVTADDFDTVGGVNPFSAPVNFSLVNNVGTFTVPIRNDFVVSRSGSTWTGASAASANDWKSVAYGDGVWIAVAFGGTNRAMRSTNGGASWSALGTGVGVAANRWQSVAYGDGVWVAVSSDGTNRVMRSTNGGASWTAVAAAAANSWRSVAYGDGVWVAVSEDGTNRVMRSTNGGASWTAVAAAAANRWQSVAYGDGVWIAVAGDGTNRVMRSTDGGASWTAVAAAEANFWLSVAYGDGVWVAVAFNGTNRVMRSTDGGVTWAAVAATQETQWYSVAYGDGVWVAVAYSYPEAMRSTNGGISWTEVEGEQLSSNWISVAYGAGMWVAVAPLGSTGSQRVMRSGRDQGFHVDILPQNTTTLLQRSAVITIVEQNAATITANANTVNEGSNVTFTVTTTNFGNGVLYWTTAGTATGNDFVAANGNVTITGDSGSFIISAVADQITEGEKTFFVQLRTDSATGNILATSEIITIVDTSL